MDKDNLFFPVMAGMAISVNRKNDDENPRYPEVIQNEMPRPLLTKANCYEQGFRFDEIERRFK